MALRRPKIHPWQALRPLKEASRGLIEANVALAEGS